MKKDQVEFHFAHTEGTLIGLYCPSFIGGLNMPGYHFHYLSDDRKEGGHVFDLCLKEGKAEFCLLSDFKLKLPRSSRFGKIDFTGNLDEAVKRWKGEGGRLSAVRCRLSAVLMDGVGIPL